MHSYMYIKRKHHIENMSEKYDKNSGATGKTRTDHAFHKLLSFMSILS